MVEILSLVDVCTLWAQSCCNWPALLTQCQSFRCTPTTRLKLMLTMTSQILVDNDVTDTDAASVADDGASVRDVNLHV